MAIAELMICDWTERLLLCSAVVGRCGVIEGGWCSFVQNFMSRLCIGSASAFLTICDSSWIAFSAAFSWDNSSVRPFPEQICKELKSFWTYIFIQIFTIGFSMPSVTNEKYCSSFELLVWKTKNIKNSFSNYLSQKKILFITKI